MLPGLKSGVDFVINFNLIHQWGAWSSESTLNEDCSFLDLPGDLPVLLEGSGKPHFHSSPFPVSTVGWSMRAVLILPRGS